MIVEPMISLRPKDVQMHSPVMDQLWILSKVDGKLRVTNQSGVKIPGQGKIVVEQYRDMAMKHMCRVTVHISCKPNTNDYACYYHPEKNMVFLPDGDMIQSISEPEPEPIEHGMLWVKVQLNCML